LKDIADADLTAKDFRTWTGTVLAALALSELEKVDSEAAAKRNIRAAIEQVSARLGNTPTVCRKCYVHPEILDSYLADALVLEVKQEVERELSDDETALRPEEALVLAFLQRPACRKKEAMAA
jgi:DNA topoisomerase I